MQSQSYIDITKSSFNVKSEIWKIENEWRIYLERSDTRTKILRYPIGAEAIKCVYLGLEAPPYSRADFNFEMREKVRGASLFQARKTSGRMAVEFSEVAWS
jgi:hypothetical protein